MHRHPQYPLEIANSVMKTMGHTAFANHTGNTVLLWLQNRNRTKNTQRRPTTGHSMRSGTQSALKPAITRPATCAQPRAQ